MGELKNYSNPEDMQMMMKKMELMSGLASAGAQAVDSLARTESVSASSVAEVQGKILDNDQVVYTRTTEALERTFGTKPEDVLDLYKEHNRAQTEHLVAVKPKRGLFDFLSGIFRF